MRFPLPVAILIVVPFAACLDDLHGGGDACTAPPQSIIELPLADLEFQTDPSQDWDTLVRLNDSTPVEWSEVPPDGWSGAWTSYNLTNSSASLVNYRLTPGGTARGGRAVVSWITDDRKEDCDAERGGTFGWELDAPSGGSIAMPGKGVRVYTAGFWENGTLFYTNIQALDQSAWPRAGWYAWEGGDPLPVYVYEKDRSERSHHWCPAGIDPEFEQVSGCYFTTIQGFNGALKGLSSHTTRVVRMDPEEAYTAPNYAGDGTTAPHPLYGDALIFWIKIVEVSDIPCGETFPLPSCSLPTP